MKITRGLVATILIISVLAVLVVVAIIVLVTFLPKAANSSPWTVYYDGNFRILNVPYNDSLAASSSMEFFVLADEIHTQLKSVYSKSGLSNQFDLAQVVEFSPGSVKVALVLQFKGNGSSPDVIVGAVKETFQQNLTPVNASSTSGSLDRFVIDLTSIQFTEISKAEAEALFFKVSKNVSAVPNSDAATTTDMPTTLTSNGESPNSTLLTTSATPDMTTADVTISTVTSIGSTAPTMATSIVTSRNNVTSPTCGSQFPTSSKIVGGTASVNGEWPWQVSLHVQSHVCGASIISDRWLISAAHCFQNSLNNPSVWRAYMGSVELGQGTLRAIKRIINHPSYGTVTRNNYDVAVLELFNPLNFSNFIQPICLPSSSQVFPAGQLCTITGWGTLTYQGQSPDTLQKGDVAIIEDQTCNSSYGSLITPIMLCAGILTGGVDSCQAYGMLAIISCDMEHKNWGIRL
ncbi:transmembrane protease serine 11B-like protein isoform X2 [Pristis pectinata]|uniref:transmembrane protease serine 11B-like protein isoform X2 n=1 Tax=Pristis pectinata TaxID=685728 RepID=UPI00223E5509|nr:transmembrane protease serine 11B-like protein isoform X2 [Pristis pectinata]